MCWHVAKRKWLRRFFFATQDTLARYVFEIDTSLRLISTLHFVFLHRPLNASYGTRRHTHRSAADAIHFYYSLFISLHQPRSSLMPVTPRGSSCRQMSTSVAVSMACPWPEWQLDHTRVQTTEVFAHHKLCHLLCIESPVPWRERLLRMQRRKKKEKKCFGQQKKSSVVTAICWSPF